jgi:hypothetical protein
MKHKEILCQKHDIRKYLKIVGNILGNIRKYLVNS